MKRIVAFLMALTLLYGMSGCSVSGQVTVLDGQGAVIATLTQRDFSDSDLTQAGYRSYVELAVQEATAVLMGMYSCDAEAAQRKLFGGDYTLHTAFDPAVYTAIDGMYAAYAAEALPLGCAINDYAGNILAVYSGGEGLQGLTPHSPFSTIKPLSVYAPAIEAGQMDWSTRIEDKPYKQIAGEDGRLSDWPQNASGVFSYEDTSIADCIKHSLNTAAVHGLASFGVERSAAFLQNSFGLNLNFEQNKIALEGDEEVIGNLAMGYLYTGVTPAQLAGCYQVFGYSGWYITPRAVTAITYADGSVLYTRQEQYKRVLSDQTAFVMNKLLQTVMQPDGTGAQAAVKGLPVAGKTGTGSDEGGNWFVGVTPDYACAVWHGGEQRNMAARLFAEIFSAMPKGTHTDFPVCDGVEQVVCCGKSGMKYTSACTSIQVGYYAADRVPADCDKH